MKAGYGDIIELAYDAGYQYDPLTGKYQQTRMYDLASVNVHPDHVYYNGMNGNWEVMTYVDGRRFGIKEPEKKERPRDQLYRNMFMRKARSGNLNAKGLTS